MLLAFLIGYSLMFSAHYLLEPTWQVGEPRSNPLRMIFNYAVGVTGISIAFLSLHPDLWRDLLVSIGGAGFATVLAHGRDALYHGLRELRAHGLTKEREEQKRRD